MALHLTGAHDRQVAGIIQLVLRARLQCGDDEVHALIIWRLDVAAANVIQRLSAGGVVNGAAIIGIHQVVGKELGALVDVGDAGSHELHKLLRQIRGLGSRCDEINEGGDLVRLVVEEIVDPGVDAVFEVFFHVEPGGAHPGLAHGLFGIGVESLAQLIGQRFPVRPHTNEVLQQEVAGGAIHVLDGGAQLRELLRSLGDGTDAGPHDLSALRVVGGQSRHGVRPQAGALGLEEVEFSRGQATPLRCPADFLQAHETGATVERRILYTLGHHGTAHLGETRVRFATGNECGSDEIERVCPLRVLNDHLRDHG